MNDLINNANWIAIIISSIITFFLSWLWYSKVLFGRIWAIGVGVPEDKLDEPRETPPILAIITQAMGTFLFAWVVNLTVIYNALLSMIISICAIVLFITSTGILAKKSSSAIFIESGYLVAMVTIMIGIGLYLN